MVDVARTGVFFHVRFNGKRHAFFVTSGPRRAIEVSSTTMTSSLGGPTHAIHTIP
jgi:hypothetical protein